MRVVALLLVCAVAHAAPSQKSSDSAEVSQALAQIAKLESSLEYEQALLLADRTIDRGVASRDQLADLNLIAGRLAAGLDHPEDAQKHFARVLALRPATQLVAGTSPKLQAPFDAARAANPELELRLDVAATKATVIVQRDPLGLAVGIRVVLRDGSLVSAKALELALPANADVASIAATDEHGNELAIRSIEPQVLPIVQPERPSTLFKHWVTYTALSGAALVAGGLCAWRFAAAQDEWNRLDAEGGHGYSQLHAIEQRGQRFAIAADITFGVAAVAGVVASALYLTRDPEPSRFVFTGNGATFIAHF